MFRIYAIYTNDELVAYLLQSEWDDRQNRKIERLTKAAHFRYSAVMEAIDYDASRSLDKNQIQRFSSCNFIEQKTEHTYYREHRCREKLYGIRNWSSSLFIRLQSNVF
uniref:ATP-binding protein n=1 Tax=Paenimyroides baculatum TaxID=2608000 RepID=UPI0021CFAA24|nr:ATP-binding protein [Paenimyroides baculatum]